jgi:hypothetical protein
MVQFFSKQHISWFHTSVAIQTEQQQQKQPTTNKQQFVRPHQPLAPPPGLTNLPFKLDVVTREQLLGGQLLLYTVDKFVRLSLICKRKNSTLTVVPWPQAFHVHYGNCTRRSTVRGLGYRSGVYIELHEQLCR